MTTKQDEINYDQHKNNDLSTEGEINHTLTTTAATAGSGNNKRRGNDMTKDDYDDNDDDDGDDDDISQQQQKSFPKASEEVMKQRRILKVVRQPVIIPSDTTTITNSSVIIPPNDNTKSNSNNNNANPFGSIQLTATTITKPTAEAAVAAISTTADKKVDDKETKPFIFGAAMNFTGFGMTSASSSITTAGNGGFFGVTTSGTGGFGTTSSSGFGTSLSNEKPVLSFGGFGSSTSSYMAKDDGTAAATSTQNNRTIHPFVFSAAATTDSKTSNKGFLNNLSSDSNPVSSDQTSTNNHFADVFGNANSTNTPSSSFMMDSTPATTLPSDYDLKSGEEDEINLFTIRCKAFRWGPPSSNSNNGNNNTGGLHNGGEATATEVRTQHSSVPPSHLSLILPSSSTSSFGGPPPAPSRVSQQQHIDEADMAASGSALPAVSSSITQETDAVVADSATAATDGTHDDNNNNTQNKFASNDDYAWHELGIGPLRLLQTKESNGGIVNDNNITTTKRFRLVQRRESTAGGSGTAVILNLRLSLSHTTIVSPTEKHIRISTAVVTTNTTTTNNSTSIESNDNENDHNHENNKVELALFLFKFKLASEASEFVECIENHVLNNNDNNISLFSHDINDEEAILQKNDDE